MKRINLLILFLLLANLSLFAQQNINDAVESPKNSKVANTLSKFSVTATAATPSVNFKEMNNATLKKAKGISMGELSINYKMNSRISFGLGTMGSLGLCFSGYYNAEGNFVPFSSDDDDENDTEDGDGDDDAEDDDDDCGEFGDNIMGTFTFKLSEKIPFFVQAAGGYSFGSNAPAYSAMIGYNQKVFKGLGIVGGIRFSDVLYQKPADAVKMAPSSGLRAELGLSWNF
jgi:hypothetical protein